MNFKSDMKFPNEKIDLFVVIEFVLCAIIILSTLLMRDEITSKAFTVSFIVLLLNFVYTLLSKRQIKGIGITVCIIFFSGFFVATATIICGKSFSFDYLKEYFIFSATILLMLLWSNIEISNKTTDFILKFNIFIAALYPIAYRFFPQNGKFNDLSLNFSNPNLTGMWILQSLLYLVLGFLNLRKLIWKLICLALFVLNLNLLNLTGARNCLLSLFLFAAMIIWLIIRNLKRFSKLILVFVNIAPICFVPVYLYFINSLISKGWLAFMISEGKPLTSRVEIWNRVLNTLNGYWIIGNYPELAGNTHNSHLVILSSYGLIVLVLVIAMLYSISKRLNNNITSKRQAFALSAFFASLFMGFGEGALFSGGQGIYIMVCGFILLAKGNYNEDEQTLLRSTDQK